MLSLLHRLCPPAKRDKDRDPGRAGASEDDVVVGVVFRFSSFIGLVTFRFCVVTKELNYPAGDLRSTPPPSTIPHTTLPLLRLRLRWLLV